MIKFSFNFIPIILLQGTNHLGQLALTNAEQQNQVHIPTADYFYPKNKQFSSHRNHYELANDQTS